MFLIKEDIYSLDTKTITTNILRKVETTRKGHFFKIGKKVVIGQEDILQIVKMKVLPRHY